MEKLKEAMKKKADKNISLMLDTKGPEILTGQNRDNKVIDI